MIIARQSMDDVDTAGATVTLLSSFAATWLLAVVLCMTSTLSCLAADLSQNITAARPDADTQAMKSKVESILSSVPTTVRDSVFDAGCKVVIVPTVSEYTATGYSDKPRGYTNGGGYDNADGLFLASKNELLVAERVSFKNGAPIPAYRTGYVIRHEFGHAYDQYLGRKFKSTWAITTSPKFEETHRQEVQRLTNNVRSQIAYFCQEGHAGASETFAELFCLRCLPQSEWSNRQKAVLAAFPQTDALVKAAMDSPTTVASWDTSQ